MIALLALLLATRADFPPMGSPADKADAAAMEKAGGYEMFLPVRRCVRETARAYRPRADEIGNKAASEAFARRTLRACGYDTNAARLLAALRRADPKTDQRIIRRRAERELLPVRGEAEMYSEDAVRMPPPPPPRLVPLCPGPNCLTYPPGIQ